jgi:4-hydroxy-tetrahydrodipicolinate synthase
MKWHGVIPAVTTGFNADLTVDRDFVARHVQWLVQNGCAGIVALGSLGEGATLSFEEKVEVLETCVGALQKRAPVVAGISSLSTGEAVRLATRAAEVGCDGLMVLPPYVYSTDWREMKAHVSTIISATELSCMLYNNPIAYKTDFLPEHIAELAVDHPNLHAVKESSADVRRITALRALLEDRLALFVGVDDVIVEGIRASATGWIAGLANALPRESVVLFEEARKGNEQKLLPLYQWFLPLLRMDTGPKFVQLIKVVQSQVGMGSARVRPPRLELEGKELADAMKVIEKALASRPSLD